jgi:CheY-like chemotaxis protein
MSEPKKILVVEDEPEIAELIGEFCRILGFQSKILNHGQEVLREAKTYRPNLITLDLMLPDISGLDLLEALRADPRTKDIPVVVISAIASEPDVRHLLHHHCQGVMTKPFRGSALKKTLHRILPLEVPVV